MKRIVLRPLRHKGELNVVVEFKFDHAIKAHLKQYRPTTRTNLSPESKKALWDYVSYLRGKRFSESTVRTY